MRHVLYLYSKEGNPPNKNRLQKVQNRFSTPFLALNKIRTLYRTKTELLVNFDSRYKNRFRDTKDGVEYCMDEVTFSIDGDQTEIKVNTSQMRDFWYVNTDDYFAVSTSQRILVMILEDYQPDPGTKAWMLSAGTLGPKNSWDKRIMRVNPWVALRFDKERETVKEVTHFHSSNGVATDNAISALDAALEDSLTGLNLDNDNWSLTLSGGVDSRVLFHKLRHQYDLKCVTWGFEADQGMSKNDLDISKRLTSEYDVEHDVRIINESEYVAEEVLKRFIHFSEGTLDHLTGYIDGFELWNSFKEAGVDFVLRGDNLFFKHTSQPPMLTDYNELSVSWGEYQRWPTQFERRKEESVDQWQTRIYRDYRIPTVMSSLNSVKVPFVGVVNPYLSESMLEFTSSLPSSKVVGKDVLKQYVRTFDDNIPYAGRSTQQSLNHILCQRDFQMVMQDSLQSQESVVSKELFNSLVKDINSTEETTNRPDLMNRIKTLFGRYLPDRIVHWIINNKRKNMTVSNERLLFRLFIIEEMDKILRKDISIIN